jgi:hypothetical protein
MACGLCNNSSFPDPAMTWPRIQELYAALQQVVQLALVLMEDITCQLAAEREHDGTKSKKKKKKKTAIYY